MGLRRHLHQLVIRVNRTKAAISLRQRDGVERAQWIREVGRVIHTKPSNADGGESNSPVIVDFISQA